MICVQTGWGLQSILIIGSMAIAERLLRFKSVAKGDFSLTDFAKMIWGKRAEGLPVPELNLSNEVTEQELTNLQLRFAFVQLVNPDRKGESAEVRLIRAKSGWIILDYGAALTTSPGAQLFTHGEYTRGEDGTLEPVCTGKGTIIKQIIDTAADMVHLAKERGWREVQIVDGHRFMSWAVWIACEDLAIPVKGFVPSLEERAKYEQIKKKRRDTQPLQPEAPGV